MVIFLEVPVEDLRAARLRKLEIAQTQEKQQIQKTIDTLKSKPVLHNMDDTFAQPMAVTPSDDGYDDDFEILSTDKSKRRKSEKIIQEQVEEEEIISQVKTPPISRRNDTDSLEHIDKVKIEQG